MVKNVTLVYRSKEEIIKLLYFHILSPSNMGVIRTLDLKIMGHMFYHCATASGTRGHVHQEHHQHF